MGTRSSLCLRMDLINWKTSTTPSILSRSNWACTVMNTPVRPIPLLHNCVCVWELVSVCSRLTHLHMTTIGLFPEAIWMELTSCITSSRGVVFCGGPSLSSNWSETTSPWLQVGQLSQLKTLTTLLHHNLHRNQMIAEWWQSHHMFLSFPGI